MHASQLLTRRPSSLRMPAPTPCTSHPALSPAQTSRSSQEAVGSYKPTAAQSALCRTCRTCWLAAAAAVLVRSLTAALTCGMHACYSVPQAGHGLDGSNSISGIEVGQMPHRKPNTFSAVRSLVSSADIPKANSSWICPTQCPAKAVSTAHVARGSTAGQWGPTPQTPRWCSLHRGTHQATAADTSPVAVSGAQNRTAQ